MLQDIFKKQAGMLPNYAAPKMNALAAPIPQAPPVTPSTEPGSVRLTPVGSQGQPMSFPAPNQPAALSRTTAAPGLVNTGGQTKTPANVQAILRRLLAPPSMLPTYPN